MNLFELKNNVLQIQPEAYALGPFKKIWDRDKTKDKKKAIAELAYVYYTTDWGSDFSNILDEEERKEEVIKSCVHIKGWKPDKVVEDAIKFYNQRQETIKLTLLQDARHGINNLSKYLRTVNFDDVEINEKTGDVKPKHDAKKYADTVKQIPAIIEALDTLEKAVKEEKEVEKGLRGGRKKGLYIDG